MIVLKNTTSSNPSSESLTLHGKRKMRAVKRRFHIWRSGWTQFKNIKNIQTNVILEWSIACNAYLKKINLTRR